MNENYSGEENILSTGEKQQQIEQTSGMQGAPQNPMQNGGQNQLPPVYHGNQNPVAPMPQMGPQQNPPMRNQGAPMGNPLPPVQNQGVPMGNPLPPVQNQGVPLGNPLPPVQNQGVPMGNPLPPVQNQGVPMGNPLPPMQNQGVPMGNPLPPVQNQGVPMGNPLPPVQNQGVPMGNPLPPVQNQGVPMGNPLPPVQNQGVPMGNRVPPVQNQGAPMGNPLPPVQNQGAPMGNSMPPVQNQGNFVQNQGTSGQTQGSPKETHQNPIQGLPVPPMEGQNLPPIQNVVQETLPNDQELDGVYESFLASQGVDEYDLSQYQQMAYGSKEGVSGGTGANFQSGTVPWSQEAERAVLGSILQDISCLPLVIEQLKIEDFHDKLYQDIYKAVYGLFNVSSPADMVTVHHTVMTYGKYKEDEVRNTIKNIIQMTATSANVKEYVNIMKEKSLLRKLGEIGKEVTDQVEAGRESGTNVLELTETKIGALRRGRSTAGLMPMEQVLGQVQERLDERAQNESDITGISTGLPDLDKALSGLNSTNLILLAARPAMGKTSLALNFLLHAGKYSKKNVAFFSLEMSCEQLGMRLVATEAFVDNRKLSSGQLNEKEWDKVIEAFDSLLMTTIFIDDDSMATVAEINAKCKRLDNLGLIVIDYLQLMTSAGKKSGGGENRQQVVSDISRTLKLMANELDVPVVCLSQLSRKSEARDNKRPMLSDLRESGAIEQDADIVMFIYRDDYYNPDTDKHNIAECIIAKNRHGETGTVELQWIPEFTAFRTLERRYDEQ